jgi:hypothetical protein
MYTIRKTRQELVDLRRQMEDVRMKTDEAGPRNEQTNLEPLSLNFLVPPGFTPAAYLIVAVDEAGQSFINAPTEQPHACLLLAQKAIDFAAPLAGQWIQQKKLAESTIIQAPAHLAKGLIRPA